MAILFPASPTNGQTVTINGKNYIYSASKSAWMITSSGLTDATSDGKVYARKDGAWVEIPSKTQITIYASAAVVDNELLLRHVTTVPFKIPVDFLGSLATCDGMPIGSAVFTVKKNTTTIGTFSFGTSVQTAVPLLATETTFDIGDRLYVYGPATANPSVSDLSINILAEGV